MLEKRTKALEKALTSIDMLKAELTTQQDVRTLFLCVYTKSLLTYYIFSLCVQRYNSVGVWCNSFQDAMTECLPDEVICTVNRKLKEDLKNDSLLGKSRLGILLDILQSTTLSRTYKELVDKAEEFRAGNDKRKDIVSKKCKRSNKRSKVNEQSADVTLGKKQLAREGVLRNIIAVNIESIRQANNKCKK